MIAQRLAIVAIVATWSVPTIVGAQHAKAESTAAHASAPAKESAKERPAEHASSPAKKDAAAEPVPQKPPAKEASKDSGKTGAMPIPEHAAAKSDGKDRDTGSRHVEDAVRQAEHQEKSAAAKNGPGRAKGSVPAHASAEKASSEKDAEVAGTASSRTKTAPKNEREAAL